MQQTIKRNEQIDTPTLPQVATSQGGATLQLILSYLLVGAVALCLAFLLTRLGVQQLYILLIALPGAGVCGLLCTLNLQYDLYLLELKLSRLAHGQLRAGMGNESDRKYLLRRWPLSPLFLRLQEIEHRMQHLATSELLSADLREKTLQQTREAAALAERNRIARELHDSIKQQIFSMSVGAAAARAVWQEGNAADAREALEDIQRSAKEAQVEMQALLQQLRPAPLENTSLIEALHVQAQALSFRTGAQMHLELGGLPENDRLLPGTQETIFRLVQEAFANIARHARARTVWLALRTLEQSLYIEIRDDGQGFDPAAVPAGMGLSNMQERVQELHGTVEITSQPGQGTGILISIPLLEASHDLAEEARQRYELARADELARRGYQLCANASYLGIAMALLGIIISLSFAWDMAVFGSLLIAISGYISGAFYRARVALSAGRESRVTLELDQYQYRVSMDMVRLASLGVLCAYNLVKLLHANPGHWLFLAAFVCLLGLVQFSRWRYYLNTERYYRLLSTQELSWELEQRGRVFIRSLVFLSVIYAGGLVFAHSLFVLSPQTPQQQDAYAIALLLLVIGVGKIFDSIQIKRWRQQLHEHEHRISARRKEG